MKAGRSLRVESRSVGDDWTKGGGFVVGSGMILLLGLDIPVT